MSIIYIEPISPSKLSTIPSCINLNTPLCKEVVLFRLLLGTCDIKYEYNAKSILVKQRKNLSNALGTTNRIINSTIFTDYLTPLTTSDLEQYLHNTQHSNVNFINELTNEYSYFFINEHKGNHTNAFIHCYRLLEYISYSFPLIFASLSNNYEGTFNDLKSYFTKDGGEITFLEKFVKKLIIEGIRDSTFDINVRAPTAILQNKIYVTLKSTLNALNPTYDDSLYKISFKYSDLIEIIRILRNRFFHFAIGGQKNIKLSDIVYPDLFFSQVNFHAINWLSIIYFEILKNSIDRWK